MMNKYVVKNVEGNGNNIFNGETHIIIESPPDENIMYSLLKNIAKMLYDREYRPEIPDTDLYNIFDKIEFNHITKYHKFYDFYNDGMCIIEKRLRDFEESADGTIRHQIIRYIQIIYYDIRCNFQNKTSDELIKALESKLKDDLKEYYRTILSPEDLSYIDIVIFYVFASCKIFDKPTNEYLAHKYANS